VEGVVSNRLLWNLKKDFATKVSEMGIEEIFGIKGNSESSWNCLYRQFLIIDVLGRYKAKCVNFNVKYDVVLRTTVIIIEPFGPVTQYAYLFVVDDVDFTAVTGDELVVSIEDGYFQTQTISYVSKYPDINAGLYSFLTGLGYSSDLSIVSFTDVTYSEESTGTISLYSNHEISFDQRELMQEDLDCLIEKIC